MIKINDKYGIKFTEIAVELHISRKNSKTGEVYFKPQYYYSTLSDCLAGIVDRGIDADITSLELLNDKIIELKADIKAFCKKQACQKP